MGKPPSAGVCRIVWRRFVQNSTDPVSVEATTDSYATRRPVRPSTDPVSVIGGGQQSQSTL